MLRWTPLHSPSRIAFYALAKQTTLHRRNVVSGKSDKATLRTQPGHTQSVDPKRGRVKSHPSSRELLIPDKEVKLKRTVAASQMIVDDLDLVREKFPTRSALDVLVPLQNLVKECNSTNKGTGKLDLLRQNYECLPILEYIYNQQRRFYVTSKSVLQRREVAPSSSIDVLRYPSIHALLEALSTGKITGNEALDTVIAFINQHVPKEFETTFWGILDRNMKMGVSIQSIKKAFTTCLDVSTVALAHTAREKDIERISSGKDDAAWFASRKYDGIRCLSIVDPKRREVTLFSRNNKRLDNIPYINEEILRLCDISKSTMQESYSESPEAGPVHQEFDDGKIVLDGELCLTPGAIFDHSELQSLIRYVRPVSGSIPPEPSSPGSANVPVDYRVFDLLTLKEFRTGTGNRPLSNRFVALRKFIPDGNSTVKYVEQVKIPKERPLCDMIQESNENGWEGVMLRKDIGYQGKRTRNLLKVKQWQEEEFVVKNAETGLMRVMQSDGSFADETLLTNVIIHIDDDPTHAVSVGSGFSLDQRRAFAANPDSIINSEITVRYMSQSRSLKRGDAISLRSPTVKAVYQGKRDL